MTYQQKGLQGVSLVRDPEEKLGKKERKRRRKKGKIERESE